MRPFPNHRGFTLVEVMAAMALSGLAIAGGVALFRQLDDETRRIRVESAQASRSMNGERLLRTLLRNAELSVDSAETFHGDERALSFRSWCASPAGWLDRCQVVLDIVRLSDSSEVVARLSTGEQLVLGVFAGGVEFRYLDLITRDPVWLKSWSGSLALPGAVGMARDRDTIVFAVGAARD